MLYIHERVVEKFCISSLVDVLLILKFAACIISELLITLMVPAKMLIETVITNKPYPGIGD
jgi:hypothetical protein